MPGIIIPECLQEVTRQPQTSTRTIKGLGGDTFMQQLRQQQLKQVAFQQRLKGALSRRRELIHIHLEVNMIVVPLLPSGKRVLYLFSEKKTDDEHCLSGLR
ncbi:hypothetical protein SPFM8_00215 [Salmonella phage SPFM8]|nr:hypothetical protein SPFM8_00215 [Salmonella phage SPFM8]